MKKRLVVLLTIVCVVCCALSLVACSNGITLRDITLDVDHLNLAKGETATLTATITPQEADDKDIEWSSSNHGVAIVEDGLVTAIDGGATTITATLSNGKYATCEVYVFADQDGDSSMQFTVTFDANGGKFSDGSDTFKTTVKWGDHLDSVKVTRDGKKYHLIGWYIKGQPDSGAWNFDSDNVFDDITLYAHWSYSNDYWSIKFIFSTLTQNNYEKHGEKNVNVDIISVYEDSDEYLCFIEKDKFGVNTYKSQLKYSDFSSLDTYKELLEADFENYFTKIDSYDYCYNSDNNFYIADNLPPKYPVVDPNVNTYEHPENKIDCSVIFACVSDWELDNDPSHNTTTNGPWYSCKIKALMVDEDGNIFTYSATIVSGTNNFNEVLGGLFLSEDYDQVITYLGDLADNYYSEYLLEKEVDIYY